MTNVDLKILAVKTLINQLLHQLNVNLLQNTLNFYLEVFIKCKFILFNHFACEFPSNFENLKTNKHGTLFSLRN